MSAFNTAWGLLKSRTYRDQSSDWGSPHRSGEAKQPYTNFHLKQRVPLVGDAPRVDRNYEERSDVTTHPRYQEQAAMEREMGLEQQPKDFKSVMQIHNPVKSLEELSDYDEHKNRMAIDKNRMAIENREHEQGNPMPPISEGEPLPPNLDVELGGAPRHPIDGWNKEEIDRPPGGGIAGGLYDKWGRPLGGGMGPQGRRMKELTPGQQSMEEYLNNTGGQQWEQILDKYGPEEATKNLVSRGMSAEEAHAKILGNIHNMTPMNKAFNFIKALNTPTGDTGATGRINPEHEERLAEYARIFKPRGKKHQNTTPTPTVPPEDEEETPYSNEDEG